MTEYEITLPELKEKFEKLRKLYFELEAKYELLVLREGFNVEGMESKKRELAEWASMEAGRWLDVRAGDGPESKMGQNLREIAALLVKEG